MDFEPTQKLNILLAALAERYQAMRTIRDRVQAIGLWALGILVGAGGWVIQSKTEFTCVGKFVVLLGLAAAFVPLRFLYLADLEKGFKGQQRVAARIETVLGLYKVGMFDETDAPIYPSGWEAAGSDKGAGRFFRTTYILIYSGLAFLTLTILFVG